MPNPPPDLETRFNHHPPLCRGVERRHEDVRGAFKVVSSIVMELVPAGREQAIALTKLEEGMMWSNAGIARALSTPRTGKRAGAPLPETNVSDTYRDRKKP